MEKININKFKDELELLLDSTMKDLAMIEKSGKLNIEEKEMLIYRVKLRHQAINIIAASILKQRIDSGNMLAIQGNI